MSTWQVEGYLEETGGVLHIGGVSAVHLADRHGTPLFVFSEARIRHNAQAIRAAFGRSQRHVRIFYASKANSNLAVLQIVRDAGLDVEVNSGGELYKALKAGFRPDQIVFNGVAKTEQEITEAVQRGIFCLNVDSACELDRVLSVARRTGLRANIALRIVPDVGAKTHHGLVTGTHHTKFGIANHLLTDTYREALRHPAQVALIGLNTHVGSQVTNAEDYRAAFRALLIRAAQLYEETGHAVTHLNIGGGFPVSFIKEGDEALRDQLTGSDGRASTTYALLRGLLSLNKIAEATVGQMEEDGLQDELRLISAGFTEKLPGMMLALEPGTRVVADAAVLLTRIQCTKRQAPQAGDCWLLVDAGFNTLLDVMAYTWYFHALAASKADQPADQPYRLAGPLCDSADVYHDSAGLGRLPDHRWLPAAMQPGDLIALLDVGGYTLEQMNQYNGQPRAAAVLVRQNGEVQVIRRRETYEDLVSHDVMLAEL